ncbi:MAG: ABC transporter permease [Anaerolineales bacterium]|nr:MAG: ABC transporter permease [Anaerolineales bacterium]
MLRFLTRRLVLFPFILLFANLFGYLFAFLNAPVVLTNNPYSRGNLEVPPVLPEYLNYLKGTVQGNFGTTFTGEGVLTAISRVGIASLGLIGIALALSIVIGIMLGRLAVRRNRVGVSTWLTFLSTIGLALPSFYIAMLLITFLLLILLYAIPGGTTIIPFQGFGWDAHLILPVLALTIQPAAKIAQVTGSLLSEEMEKPYITASLSFGHSFKTLKSKFAFRSVLAPILLTIAASLRMMIAELIIIERLFNWPGIGRLIASTLSIGARSQDILSPPLIAALLTVLVALFLFIDLLATSISRIMDPRLRVESEALPSQ